MALQPGSRLGSDEVLSLIGAGLDRKVAIKVPRAPTFAVLYSSHAAAPVSPKILRSRYGSLCPVGDATHSGKHLAGDHAVQRDRPANAYPRRRSSRTGVNRSGPTRSCRSRSGRSPRLGLAARANRRASSGCAAPAPEAAPAWRAPSLRPCGPATSRSTRSS